ncbi:AraC family transcriptional regulator [Shewanella chilikensis]|uniref:AraC family transcriptional regulator n=1 Tax=Shewanella chilikensis TaxID=558541 RepID=UPI001CFA01D7|nr:AraC family transcriptional regulator [Shewanella chilikensis]
MAMQIKYRANMMVGDQAYPAFELANLIRFIQSQLGTEATEELCQHIGTGINELKECQWVRVWQLSATIAFLMQRSRREDVSLLAGLYTRVTDLGFLLPLLGECRSLGECLEFVLNHPKWVGSFADLLLLEDEHQISLRWLNTGRAEPLIYRGEFLHSIGALLSLARELTGQEIVFNAISITGTLRPSAGLAKLAKRVEFQSDFNEWRLDKSWLGLAVDLTQFSARSQNFEQQSSLIEKIIDELDGDFPFVPTLETMALRLHMSSRSLRRKLAALGSSYQRLVDQQRCQRAVSWILEGQLSVSEIAERLGYSDSCHFRQSFKHWLGYPPGYFSRLGQQN